MKKAVLLLVFMICGGFAMAQAPSSYNGVWMEGTTLRSPNGRFTLTYQDDGNLVIYKNGNQPIWASNTTGRNAARRLMFQEDGNLVIYDKNQKPIWASNSENKGGKYIVMQDDGNLVIYTMNNHAIWATNTSGR